MRKVTIIYLIVGLLPLYP